MSAKQSRFIALNPMEIYEVSLIQIWVVYFESLRFKKKYGFSNNSIVKSINTIFKKNGKNIYRTIENVGLKQQTV